MFKFPVLQMLVAASLFAAVVSNDYEPELDMYENLPTIKIVLGDYVKGARVLDNFGFNKSSWCNSYCNYTEKFVYTVSVRSARQPITKIVVLVEKTNDEQTAEAKVVAGGIQKSHVELEIKIENCKKLNYRVVVFGLPWW